MTDQQTTSTIGTQTTTASPAPKPVDTYSYKGWLNSDKFWKRALGVYGYSLVGSLIIVIPILVCGLVFAILIGVFIFVPSGRHAQSDENREHLPLMHVKVDINRICEEALIDTNITGASSSAAYLSDCKEGKHPEVLERAIRELNLPSNVAI